MKNPKERKKKWKNDTIAASKEKEVAIKRKAKGKVVVIEEIETPNQYGPNNAYSHTFYYMEYERLF